MQKRRFAPSPAMVVALIALFIALGGTSYAALTLPKNSVGTKQLKNGAVTASKISSHALGAAKIVGRPGAPPYQAPWTDHHLCGGCAEEGVSFYKDPWGIVHLQGHAASTSGAVVGTIFTLPAGYRPASGLYFAAYGAVGTSYPTGGTPAYIRVGQNGAVDVVGPSQTFVGLNDVSFRAGL